MKQVVIENPILNSPFEEPRRHFKFTEDGITDEIVEARRVSQYFIPIPRPKKKSAKINTAASKDWQEWEIPRQTSEVSETSEVWREAEHPRRVHNGSAKVEIAFHRGLIIWFYTWRHSPNGGFMPKKVHKISCIIEIC